MTRERFSQMRVRPAKLESMRFDDFLDCCCHLFRALLHACSSSSLRCHGCQTQSLVLRDKVDVELEVNQELFERKQSRHEFKTREQSGASLLTVIAR